MIIARFCIVIFHIFIFFFQTPELVRALHTCIVYVWCFFLHAQCNFLPHFFVRFFSTLNLRLVFLICLQQQHYRSSWPSSTYAFCNMQYTNVNNCLIWSIYWSWLLFKRVLTYLHFLFLNFQFQDFFSGVMATAVEIDDIDRSLRSSASIGALFAKTASESAKHYWRINVTVQYVPQ